MYIVYKKSSPQISFLNRVKPGVDLHKICIQKVVEFFAIAKLSGHTQKRQILIGWMPPLNSWTELNADGASGNPGNRGAGGII